MTFSLGSIRLVLVKPGKLKGKNLAEPSKRRLEEMCSTFKTEEYSVGRTIKNEMGQLLNQLKEEELTWKDLPDQISNLITIWRGPERGDPIENAKLYQGGDAHLEVNVTTEFIEDLLGKKAQVDSSFGSFKGDRTEFLERITRAERKLEKRSLYNIVVCPSEVIYRYLDHVAEEIDRRGLESMGEKLELKPGLPILFNRSTLEKRVTIKIPIELEDRILSKLFSLIYEE